MNLCRFVVLCNSIACVYIATMLRGLKRHDQVLKAYIYIYINIYIYIKTSGSESRPRKVELASAHKKHDNYREYFTHNNEACKNPYKTTLPHLYIH